MRLRLLLILATAVPMQIAASEEPRACSATERSTYAEQLARAVKSAWRAPEYGQGYSCTAVISLDFRGEVLNVGVEDCSRDELVIRKSVEDAAYDASPLPLPGNRSCLDRTVRVRLEYRAPSR